MHTELYILLMAAGGAILLGLGLTFRRFRVLAAILLIVLGLVGIATVMGLFIGLPILAVGIVVLIAEFASRRRKRYEEPAQRADGHQPADSTHT